MLPTSVRNWASDRMPPVAATRATETPAARERRRSIRLPLANDDWSIAKQEAANARTAHSVWMKSCPVNVGPTGNGQRAVQVTCEATKKNPQPTQSDTAGEKVKSRRAELRMSRPAQAMTVPPATMSNSAPSNQRALGSPVAPSSLT